MRQKLLNALIEIFLAPFLFMWVWGLLNSPGDSPTYHRIMVVNAILVAGGFVFTLLALGLAAFVAAADEAKKR